MFSRKQVYSEANPAVLLKNNNVLLAGLGLVPGGVGGGAGVLGSLTQAMTEFSPVMIHLEVGDRTHTHFFFLF